MKKNNLKKGFATLSVSNGFTLIELLVVVAIIGLLATVVLAALNGSRNKGGDAAIKSNLSNMRGQAEIIYSGSGCYGDGASATCANFAFGACSFGTGNTIFANPVVAAQITAAANIGNGLASTRCVSTGSAWAAAVQLKTSDGPAPGNLLPDQWCVDSNGNSRSYKWGVGESIDSAFTGTVCK